MESNLDHVAIATDDGNSALAIATRALGATILGGGGTIGFRFVQLRVGDGERGMNLEVITPNRVEENDFLQRFIDRHGTGPHHMTFKVDDIRAKLSELEARGYAPVNVDLSNERWMEAFLLPKQAHGTVVQLAQSSWKAPTFQEQIDNAKSNGPRGEPWWDVPAFDPAAAVAVMQRIVLRVSSLGDARGLFVDVLKGDIVEESGSRLELEWPLGARLLLEERDSEGVERYDCDRLAEDVAIGSARFVGIG